MYDLGKRLELDHPLVLPTALHAPAPPPPLSPLPLCRKYLYLSTIVCSVVGQIRLPSQQRRHCDMLNNFIAFVFLRCEIVMRYSMNLDKLYTNVHLLEKVFQ